MSQSMLVVGPVAAWRKMQKTLPHIEGIDFVDFNGLTAELLERTKPDFVLSALVGAGFDALDVARLLAELGYRGRYRAVADRLPCPSVVRAEVGAIAPDLDFDVFTLSDGGNG